MNVTRKNITSLLFLILIFSVFSVGAYAQRSITGVVTQKSDGTTLPGVSVVVKGTSLGTITNFDGEYSIEVTEGATLVFTFIGYVSQEIPINQQTNIDVAMVSDIVALGEFVAIGYGTIKKEDITGSISSIGSDDLTRSPALTIDAGMQGKMPGVTLQKTSGAPGQAMRIRIRGGGSINYNNEPLYVIDGFIGGDLTSISPQDIERIDVLKDASATAVYGSRGANGVVLVTTKSAKSGDFKIAFDATYGMSQNVKSYDVLDAGSSAEFWNIGLADLNELTHQNNPAYFTDEEVQHFKENGGENYLDLLTRTAYSQNYNLSMSGGNEKLTYLLSGGYQDEQGVISESFRKRYSIRSNVKANIKPWLDMKFNTYATSENSMNTELYNRAVMDAYQYPVFYSNKDENGNFIYSGNSGYDTPYYVNSDLSGFNGVVQPGERPNPIQYNQARSNGEINNKGVTSSMDFTFHITDHLSFKTAGSGRYYSYFSAMMPLPDGVNVKSEDDISITHIKNTGTSLLNTNMLTYKNKVDKHDFSVSAMYEYSVQKNQGTSVSVDSLATTSNEWYILGNGRPKSAVSTFNERYMQSYMGRFNYSYADKYLLTATLRVDETSVFKEEYRTGYFPSFAGGWVISEENFVKSIDWINRIKLRAGYGETGNQAIGPYGTKTSLMLPTGYAGYNGHSSLNGSTIVSGVLPQTFLTSPDLQWETTIQTNVGLDFSILAGKLNMVADWYTKTTKDVILKRSIAMYNGRQSVTDNYGEINNSGFEFMTDYHAISKRDFSLNIGGNISINRNKVLDLGGEEEITLSEDLVSIGMWGYDDNNVFIVKKGEPMGLLYGIKQVGLWQEGEEDLADSFGSYPGMPRYEDVNGDSKIDANDRQVIGETQPAFTYGLNFDVSYKNLSLFVSSIGTVGNDIYNYTRHYMDKRILNPDYNNRWSPTNPGASQQRIPVGTEPANNYVASQYVENGSFFKINNLTLSYELPKRVLGPLNISRFNIFASVNNLLTITNYSGIDPESSVTDIQSDSQSGIDSFSYPLSRTFTFGLKTTF